MSLMSNFRFWRRVWTSTTLSPFAPWPNPLAAETFDFDEAFDEPFADGDLFVVVASRVVGTRGAVIGTAGPVEPVEPGFGSAVAAETPKTEAPAATAIANAAAKCAQRELRASAGGTIGVMTGESFRVATIGSGSPGATRCEAR